MKLPGIARRLLPRLGLTVLAFVLVLGVLEVAFRIFGLGPVMFRPSVEEVILPIGASRESAPHGFIPHAVLRSTYDSDPRGYFGPGCIVDCNLNSLGWRDREHAYDKPDGTIRVLGLGDSYLWGQGVRFEDTLLAQLEKRLGNAFDGFGVETINSGILGTNTRYQLASLENRGMLFDPDLVLLVFVPNDVEQTGQNRDRPRIEFFRGYTQIYLDPDRVTSRSRFFGWAKQVVLRNIRAERYIREAIESFEPDSPGWNDCRSALAEIAELCRRREVPLLIAIYPFLHDLDGGYPFRAIHEKVLEFCGEAGLQCIDLAGAFPGFEGPELWAHPTDQHPNEIAHGLAADALVTPIVSALESRGFKLRTG